MAEGGRSHSIKMLSKTLQQIQEGPRQAQKLKDLLTAPQSQRMTNVSAGCMRNTLQYFDGLTAGEFWALQSEYIL